MKKRIFLPVLILSFTVFVLIGCGRRMNSATDGTNTTTPDTTVEKNDQPSNGLTNDDNLVDGVIVGAEDTVDGVINGVDDVVDGVDNSLDNTGNTPAR